ncbi:MAG TPA: saccharopine dehydrogenase C-terminal domain-containing protein, partial [Candidatus Paceibacterota bacterium]|nr:saccharopine dehydrogenase C-terminal domain-containing protein [Candidatus Paceibacterota bacterium]
THDESITTSDYFTVRKNGKVVYRPTCHYAYHPCDAAVLSLHEMAGKNGKQQKRQRLIVDEVVSGMDELGVLLMGHKKNAYWYGSQLTIEETRRVAPNNNATSLQVAIAALSGMLWAMQHPTLGLVEPEDIDHDFVLKISKPYLGKVVGKYSDWTPLQDRGALFPEDLDRKDPWQFKNFRVS